MSIAPRGSAFTDASTGLRLARWRQRTAGLAAFQVFALWAAGVAARGVVALRVIAPRVIGRVLPWARALEVRPPQWAGPPPRRLSTQALRPLRVSAGVSSPVQAALRRRRVTEERPGFRRKLRLSARAILGLVGAGFVLALVAGVVRG